MWHEPPGPFWHPLAQVLQRGVLSTSLEALGPPQGVRGPEAAEGRALEGGAAAGTTAGTAAAADTAAVGVASLSTGSISVQRSRVFGTLGPAMRG